MKIFFQQQTGRSSPKINAFDVFFNQICMPFFNFPDHAFDHGILIHQTGTEIKITIAAGLFAKGNMKVDAGQNEI